MKVLAHVQSVDRSEDRPRSVVHKVPFPSLRAARAFARGPYSGGEKVVIVAPHKVECWEHRTVVSVEVV